MCFGFYNCRASNGSNPGERKVKRTVSNQVNYWLLHIFCPLKLKEKASNLLCLITYKIFTTAGSLFDARLKAQFHEEFLHGYSQGLVLLSVLAINMETLQN